MVFLPSSADPVGWLVNPWGEDLDKPVRLEITSRDLVCMGPQLNLLLHSIALSNEQPWRS